MRKLPSVFVLALLSAGIFVTASLSKSNDSKPPPNYVSRDAPAPSGAAKTETPAVLVDDTHVESILGKEVHSASGETLGTVTDVLVEHDGGIRAAVIDFGGFLGVGVRKIAVAWTALHFVQSKSALDAVLSMTKDQLRVAPEYRQGEPIVIVGAEVKNTTRPSGKN